jgi:hypothetical protein
MRLLPAVLVLAACGATATPVSVPEPADSPPAFALAPPRRIVSSDGRDCVIRDGALSCWTSGEPAAVVRFEHVLSLSARDDSNCAVLATGGIACFDPALLVWTEIGDRVWTDVGGIARMGTPCALHDDGRVECVPLPSGSYGYFGYEWAATRYRWVPMPRTTLDLPRVVDIAASGEHVCFALEDGGIACLDRGYTPTRLDGMPSAARVVVGDGCGEPVCALSAEGRLTCVPFGRLSVPREAIELDGIVDASLYGCVGCVVSARGQVACFGSRSARRPFATPPVLVEGLEHVVQISVGRDHVCALHEDEAVSCFEPGHPIERFPALPESAP